MTKHSNIEVFTGGIRGSLHRPHVSCDFAEALAAGRDGFRDVFDLLHIFSERSGRGDHTRATLNPLMALLAASAWERQWNALAAYSGETPPQRKPPRLVARPNKTEPMQIGCGATMLHELTNGELPAAFVMTNYQRAKGRTLLRPRKLSGSDFDPWSLNLSQNFLELGVLLNRNIELRNGVAHRVVGEKMTTAGVRSDASSGATINTSVARTSVAFFLQLVDQTTEALLNSPPPGVTLTKTDRKRIRLPRHWLSDAGGGTGARRFAPGDLWGHVDLRAPTSTH